MAKPAHARRFSLSMANILFMLALSSTSVPAWHFLFPVDVENAPQAPHVEAVLFLLLLHVGSSCVTAIEKSAEHTGLVDT